MLVSAVHFGAHVASAGNLLRTRLVRRASIFGSRLQMTGLSTAGDFESGRQLVDDLDLVSRAALRRSRAEVRRCDRDRRLRRRARGSSARADRHAPARRGRVRPPRRAAAASASDGRALTPAHSAASRASLRVASSCHQGARVGHFALFLCYWAGRISCAPRFAGLALALLLELLACRQRFFEQLLARVRFFRFRFGRSSVQLGSWLLLPDGGLLGGAGGRPGTEPGAAWQLSSPVHSPGGGWRRGSRHGEPPVHTRAS